MTERDQLEQAILALENQRAVLGDAVVDAALVSMREKLSAMTADQETTQQRKLATVLFMDIVGSTSISQGLDLPLFGGRPIQPHRLFGVALHAAAVEIHARKIGLRTRKALFRRQPRMVDADDQTRGIY